MLGNRKHSTALHHSAVQSTSGGGALHCTAPQCRAEHQWWRCTALHCTSGGGSYTTVIRRF